MKFAKELEHDLVPEWRIKYLNYKAGKKYVKGVARAVSRANATPSVASQWPAQSASRTPLSQRQWGGGPRSQPEASGGPDPSPAALGRTSRSDHTSEREPISGERRSLNRPRGNETNYGSFVRESPAGSALGTIDSRRTFELPAPAIRLSSAAVDSRESIDGNSLSGHAAGSRLGVSRSVSADIATIRSPHAATFPRQDSLLHPSPPSGRLRRLFSHGQEIQRAGDPSAAYSLQAIDTVKQREKEFFAFLDGELEKVEGFYRQKEVQAEARLDVLRTQLHEMRNRRTEEIADFRRRKERRIDRVEGPIGESSGSDGHLKWIDPIKSKLFKPGANSKALARMPWTPVVGAMSGDARRDYIRRPQEHDVPYKTAKRKLKLALQEFYRGLELLKSYAVLNRTAFRKLNKKYDKAVSARPPYRYMNQKVNKSGFVTSEIIDEHIRAVEDLYARYFEKGNHKIAAGKLRRVVRRPSDESRVAFWNGLSIGIGAVFTIQGLVYGGQRLFDPDPIIRMQTSYLFQIYGGYFLILTLFSLFCLDCYFWTTHKINYPFIFEFDTRNSLDWRQLASFSGFFLLLFGIFFWMNFAPYSHDELWLYYPVVLIAISLLIIFFPAPVLWHRSREWLAYSHFRLFFAGLYPVEFRDFFLGDIYCSLTYATSNVELFFCLYAHGWKNPPLCNSSNSRLLGFFSTLPAIWRALQCVRRYYDTNNVFPHLVNCGKYLMTILSYVTLSLYRIHNSHLNLALFITFSTVNGIYTSVWDLFMDFSLLQADARHPFLRDILGLKRRSVYYFIMIMDPILRFGWIFYAIFTHDVQHSTIISFLVSLSEVVRRGMWALLRVENEHCTNVAQYKASRDVPLPYDLPCEPLIERMNSEESSQGPDQTPSNTDATRPPSQDQQQQQPEGRPSSYAPVPIDEGGLRRRRRSELPRARSIRDIMAKAHRQDFEKKRLPVEDDRGVEAESSDEDELHSDDDDEDDDEDAVDDGTSHKMDEDGTNGDDDKADEAGPESQPAETEVQRGDSLGDDK